MANLRFLAESTGTRQLLLPVKADAYGHGSLACSFAASHSGAAAMLGVAHLFEGITLREWGQPLPVLVLGPALPEEFPHFLSHDLIPTLSGWSEIVAYEKFLASRGSSHPFHLKVDTGMNRYGVRWDEAATFDRLGDLRNARLQGLYSHLACAESQDFTFSLKQQERFLRVVHSVTPQPQWVHLSNSAGLLLHPLPQANLGRPGLAAYGCSPIDGKRGTDLGLSPVLKMRATVRQVRLVQPGEGVSYGQRWTAERETRVAAVAIGYGDGFRRNPAPGTYLRIRGTACPILGSVCMDTTLVDVSHLSEIQTGDEVEVMGSSADPALSVETLAAACHTIPYELTCGVARRLYRRYRWQGELWRWDQLRNVLGVRHSPLHGN